MVLTLLWPASSRPYIAGSTDNNFMNLVLGYNGFARVLGQNNGNFAPNPVVGASAGTQVHVFQGGHHGGFGGFGGQPQGLTRLFTGEFGFEIGWLLPAALLAMVLVLISRGRAPRTDLVRAATILFGGWMLVDGLILSYMKTMVHPYYCLSFVPAVAGMFAIGVHEMWGERESWLGRGGLVAMIAGTGVWSWWILGRNGDWLPALRWVILAVTVVAAVAVVVSLTSEARQRFAVVSLAVGLIGGATGCRRLRDSRRSVNPTTAEWPSSAPPVKAGTAVEASDRTPTTRNWKQCCVPRTPISRPPSIARLRRPALELSTNTAVMAIGGFGGSDPAPTLGEFQQDVANHRITYYIAPASNRRPGGFGSKAHSDITQWVAAHFTPMTVGSETVYDLAAPSN